MSPDHITETIDSLRFALRQLKKPTNGNAEQRLANLKIAMTAIHKAATEIVLAYTQTMTQLRNALDAAHVEAGRHAQAQHPTSPEA